MRFEHERNKENLLVFMLFMFLMKIWTFKKRAWKA